MTMSIRDGIYAITSDGETKHYTTENFGHLLDLLGLLHVVNTAKDRVPTIRTSEAKRLTLYSKKMVPISTRNSDRLFRSLDKEEYSTLMGELYGGTPKIAHYSLDYDQNQFCVLYWHGGSLKRWAAPMDQLLRAYRSSLRARNTRQQYVNTKALLNALQKIITENGGE